VGTATNFRNRGWRDFLRGINRTKIQDDDEERRMARRIERERVNGDGDEGADYGAEVRD